MNDQLQQLSARLDRLEAQATTNVIASPHRPQLRTTRPKKRRRAQADVPARASALPDPTAVPSDPNVLLGRRATAAALTACGYPTAFASLERWASTGEGPPYRKFGRHVAYKWADALAWAEARASAPARIGG
jgi:hypothetical protein